ncbi:MAG: hypothetical protein KDD67_08390 [Ignavibacteriae bacterium]|nr:hypothetical protein [Ignavibacteriota bacterium]MCB9216686.1 hypothetical protein [Ignavibacteria bacterium]
MNSSDYLNKTVLLGASWVDSANEVVDRRQVFGEIEKIDDQGIYVRLRNGDLFTMPPYPNALQPAEPGEYTVHSTLEIITNPDFLAVWTFRTETEEQS